MPDADFLASNPGHSMKNRSVTEFLVTYPETASIYRIGNISILKSIRFFLLTVLFFGNNSDSVKDMVLMNVAILSKRHIEKFGSKK